MKHILTLFIVVFAISKLTAQSIPYVEYGNVNVNAFNTATDYQLTNSPDITGISFVSTANNPLQIYPNPATNQVTVASNQSVINEIRLNNILGQTLFVKDYSQGIADLKETVDVSKLPAGLYFISVKSGNEIYVGKIMIAR